MLGNFVSLFVFAVLWGLALNGVVGEMDQFVGRFDVERFAAGANVALLICVDSEFVVEEGDEHVAADVEFSVVVEKRH